MSYRPLRADEIEHVNKEIERVKKVIAINENTIQYFENLKQTGAWVSDRTWLGKDKKEENHG